MNTLQVPNNRLVIGRVEKGKQLGRTIGFPTANLKMYENVELANGVYGVYVYHYLNRYLGILNVGNRPTFNDGDHKTFEVHILDFTRNIYDENITVELMFHIRNEKKFNQVEYLIKQLHEDAFFARKKFHHIKRK